MKQNHNLGGAVPLILSAALCAFTPALLAQSGAGAPSQDQPSHAQPQEQPPQQSAPQQSAPSQQDAQETKTFAGKIMKLQRMETLHLVTGQTPQGQPAGHFLDNQDEAKKWEGKQVTVTGTLELASNTIHIARIEAA